MKHRRNALWLASALVLTLLPAAQSAEAQTASIPLDTIPQAPPPQDGTLPNGVAFEVNCGEWLSSPDGLDGWFFSITGINPCPTVAWTFNQPVALRFGITNLQVTSDGGEGVQLPEGTEAEFIHPNHVWDPDTLIIRNGPGTTQPDESIFTHPGADEMVVVPVGAPTAQRGISFIEVTPLQADLAIEKVAEVQATKQVLFTLTVTNNGAADATGVTVDDDLPECTEYLSDDCDGAEGPPWAWDIDDLASGDSATCTITVDASACAGLGTQTNTASVEGDQPDPDTSNNTDGADFEIVGTPAITIDKSGTGPDPLQVGDTVQYSFVVINTGNVTLTNVTITDPLDGMSPIDCPGDTLAPGAEMTCTSTYTVTQEDADTGFIENTATVTGDPPDGPPVSDEDFAVVPPSQKPGISIEKSGSSPDPLEVGATIDYTFLVTNTGNVTLSNVTVTDPLPGLSPIDCPESTLAPTAEMTCTASYTVTQDDVDAGVIENTATVTGQPPGNLPAPSDQDSATFPPDQNPGIALDKTGSGPDPLTVGATVDYTFVVTNTGTVTLSNVTVTDPLPGMSPIDCPGDTLAPGAEMTCTATYTVTQQDADNGVIENTATATGDPPSGPSPTDESTTTVPPIPPVPSLPSLAFVLLVALLATSALWTLRRARA